MGWPMPSVWLWILLAQERINMDVGASNEHTRTAWVKRVLSETPAGLRILDAGAGELQYKKFCTHLDYVSQDFGLYDGRGDARGLQMGSWDQSQIDIICDITDIPEPAESFDAVMCIEVLEHLSDPPAALRELSRVLKTGGMLIVTAPFCALTHFSPHFYCTGFSSNFYTHWLRELGYELLELDYNGNYFEYLAQELRRLPWVGSEYTSTRASWRERKAMKTVLHFLERLSQNDTGSRELLNYGLHVRAQKQ